MAKEQLLAVEGPGLATSVHLQTVAGSLRVGYSSHKAWSSSRQLMCSDLAG